MGFGIWSVSGLGSCSGCLGLLLRGQQYSRYSTGSLDHWITANTMSTLVNRSVRGGRANADANASESTTAVAASSSSSVQMTQSASSFTTMLKTDSEAESIQYARRSSIDDDIDALEQMEKAVLNKIDRFLSTFESKLSNMEKYLSQSAQGVEQSASNTASAITSYAPSYSMLADTLMSVKSHLYKTQQHNLHPLTKIIDDYYEQENHHHHQYQDVGTDSPKEIVEDDVEADSGQMRKRLIATIQLLNAHLTDFEKHHNLPSLATHPSERLIALKETLYNYDTALTVSNTRHLNFYELPFQWRENRYIIYGYRFAKSHTLALTSLFSWHNETVNIWTHLLGSAYLAYLGIYHYPNTDTYNIYGATFNDHAIFYLFIASAIICLMFSVIWHSYTNIGYLSVRSKFACFDYSGITVLITSSIITTEHISLRDYPNLRLAFVSFSILAGLIGIGMAWHPYFDRPESRIVRILFFIALALLGLVSFLCSCIVQNVSFALSLFSPLCISFAWYLSGVVFYGTFFPECIRSDVEIDDFQISDDTIMELDKNGKLLEYLRKQPVHTSHCHKLTSLWWVDWIGSSHNLWHLFVIGGVLGHYNALLKMFERAYNSS